jgi:hypothetical protein
LAVGFGVGLTVGDGVSWTTGELVGATVGDVVGPVGSVAAGVGVGTTATIGPLAAGVAEGSTDGATAEGSTDGWLDSDGGWLASPGVGLAPLGSGLVAAAGIDGAGELTAIPRSGVGATTPAVSATVARMRFKSPIATTRRAR